MRPMPTWAASPSLPKAKERLGGAAACARPGSRTGGRRASRIAPMAGAAPTMLAKQCAPATIWLTSTQRWQRSGTGRPMGRGHQRLWQQVATAKQPGGVASVGTDGMPLCCPEHVGEDAPSAGVRLAAARQGSPASAMEHRTCWLSGTGKPMGDVGGTQTGLPWVQRRRCTGSSMMSASWAWCTDGRHKHVSVLVGWLAPPSPQAKLCVLATPWLCSAQRQQPCGILPRMEI